jgi:hypothetical protein|tara:strand:- start:407 stop:2335 length:1929 start_codon:yes stop_codon:yes gene_type:complete
MATRGGVTGFTAAIGDPDTRMAQPQTVAVNTELNNATANLFTGLSNTVLQGASLISEISQDKLRSDAVTGIEAEIVGSIQDPDYFKKARKELQLAASIPNSTVRQLKLQSLRKTLYANNTSKKDRLTIDQSFKDVTGYVSPTLAMAANADKIESDKRQAAVTATANTLKTAKSLGYTGTDAEVLSTYELHRSQGIALGNIGRTAGASGGGKQLSSGIFRANLNAIFDEGREIATKVATGELLPLLKKYSTASNEEKAEIRVLLGNYIDSAKIQLASIVNPNGQSNLSQAELDYMMGPATSMVQMFGSSMGLKVGELTEEKALELYEKNVESSVKIIEAQTALEMLNDPALRTMILAKNLGGEVFGNLLLDNIPILKNKIEKSLASFETGRDKKSVVQGVLSFLVEGNKKFTEDKFQKSINQSASLDIIKKGLDPTNTSILSNAAQMLVDGKAHLDTSKNQVAVLDVLGGANGKLFLQKLQKVDATQATKVIDFYNKTAQSSVSQKLLELAQVARDEDVIVTNDNGTFKVVGESSDTLEAVKEAEAAIDRLIKFKEFGPNKNKPTVELKNTIIKMQWNNIQNNLPTDSPIIEYGLSPKEFEASTAWIKIGKPVWTREPQEIKDQEVIDAQKKSESKIRILDRK